MKKKYLPFLLVAVALVAVAWGADALAQDDFGLGSAAGSKIPKTKDLAALIGSILRAALGLVGTIFLLLMLYAGFLWMTARGDSKKVDQAKQLIMGAIIGIIIVASAYAITGFVLTAVSGGGGQAEQAAETQPEGPSCSVSCTVPLDCGGIPDSCGCVVGYSCKCADGSLSTNGFPCAGSGTCVCSS